MTDEEFQAAKQRLASAVHDKRDHTRANRKLRRQVGAEERRRKAARLAKPERLFKQWGGVNKKKAGRELDGRTWDEMPGVEVSGD